MSNKKYLMIVESPSKIKTIQKYLTSDYAITASIGHIRQVQSKNNAIYHNEKTGDFKMIDEQFTFEWEIDNKKLKNILDAIKEHKPQEIILATDRDREGDAISWSIKNILINKNIKIPTSRIRFSEITKDAISDAIKNKGDIDYNLVNAYLIRVALDYKIGFTLSPVLQKQLRYLAASYNKNSNIKSRGLSAGRVQTPALVAVVNKENERDNFKSTTSYSIEAKLHNKDHENIIITAVLEKYKGQKYNPIIDKKIADDVVMDSQVTVNDIKIKKVSISPPDPFITSSLQGCSSQLSLSAKNMMSIAQTLYEKGLITYIRTDNYNISDTFMKELKKYINTNYKEYSLPKPRIVKKKSKNSQEAHECIRPTDINRTYITEKDLSDANKLRLPINQYISVYKLIHKRTVACQMANAIREQSTIILKGNNTELKYNYSRITFKGFKALDAEETTTNINIKKNDTFTVKSSKILEHKTEPPNRFSEGSLIKKMEEQGIGRPATYGSIIDKLQTREFIEITKEQIRPTPKGEIIAAFMKSLLPSYTNEQITADMENRLDKVSRGEDENIHKTLLNFFKDVDTSAEAAMKYSILDVLNKITYEMPERKCVNCKSQMHLRIVSSPYFKCYKCNATCKFKNEIIDLTEKNFKVIDKDKNIEIQYAGKKFIGPKELEKDVNLEMVRFLVTLPVKIGEYDKHNVSASFNRRGFILICDGKCYNTSFNAIYKADNTKIKEIIESVTPYIPSVNKIKNKFVRKNPNSSVNTSTNEV